MRLQPFALAHRAEVIDGQADGDRRHLQIELPFEDHPEGAVGHGRQIAAVGDAQWIEVLGSDTRCNDRQLLVNEKATVVPSETGAGLHRHETIGNPRGGLSICQGSHQFIPAFLSAQYGARRSRLSTLPAADNGRLSRNSTVFGHL
ncbi:hypothetical protein D9M71_576740 [compost metagenome]